MRHMIAMEMAEHRIGRAFWRPQNLLAHPTPPRNLQGMRQQTVAQIAQGNTRIDDNAPVRLSHQAAQSAHPERFRTNDLDTHNSPFPRFSP